MKVPNPTAIRAARKAARLTQADLAEAIGKSRETVSRLEKGDRGAGLSTVDRIAATCGVQPEFLKMEIPDAEISKPWASTEDERELLRRYRQMPKAAAVGLLLHAWRVTSPFGDQLPDSLLAAELLSMGDVESRDALKVLREAEHRVAKASASAVTAVETAANDRVVGR